ncbi:hypothetical protein, partial [Crocosphaera watsonii]|uniref:hypothetical protein n=1 Tax=Crocosphaera watsonii TaxID=263511 RepID=UPI001E5B28AE
TPSTPQDPQVGDTTNQSSTQSPTIDNNQSSSTKTESSTNGQPENSVARSCLRSVTIMASKLTAPFSD